MANLIIRPKINDAELRLLTDKAHRRSRLHALRVFAREWAATLRGGDPQGWLSWFQRARLPAPAKLWCKMRQGTVYTPFIRGVPDIRRVNYDWFGTRLMEYGGGLYVFAPQHNLAVNTGLHIAAQRTFINAAGTAMTPASGSTSDGIKGGGVDDDTTAVIATEDAFTDTSTNRQFSETWSVNPTYSTTNKRITASYNMLDTDSAVDSAGANGVLLNALVMRRFGLTNDPGVVSASNDANTLFSMLSGFLIDYNDQVFDMTVQSETDWTGS